MKILDVERSYLKSRVHFYFVKTEFIKPGGLMKLLRKLLPVVMVYFYILSLGAMTLVDGNRSFDVQLEDLIKFEAKALKTRREDKGLSDSWQGVLLRDVLSTLEITNFDQLKITSIDNYQIRITHQEIEEDTVIIATNRNGKDLDREWLRLIVPNKRDMFWVAGINVIQTESFAEMPVPNSIFFAEDVIKGNGLEDADQLLFNQITAPVFPMLQGEFLVVGRDGVSHKLDYETYFNRATLTKGDQGYDLESEDIPSGMSIKNFAYVQFFDRVLFFRDRFDSFSEVGKLLKWKELPEELNYEDGEVVSTQLEFENPEWRRGGRLIWKKQ